MRRQDDVVGQKTGERVASPWILVVHGKAGHSRPLEMMLEGAGYEVVSASEVEEARALLVYGRPDLVIVAEGQVETLAAQLASGTRARIVTIAGDEGATGLLNGRLCWPVSALLDNVSRFLASPAFDHSNDSLKEDW